MTTEEIISKLTKIIDDLLVGGTRPINTSDNFANDLGADSLDLIQLTMEIEDEFCLSISDDEAAAVETVSDAFLLVHQKLGKDEVGPWLGMPA